MHGVDICTEETYSYTEEIQMEGTYLLKKYRGSCSFHGIPSLNYKGIYKVKKAYLQFLLLWYIYP